MNTFFLLLILFQYSLLKEGNNRSIEFYSDPPATQCFNNQENPIMKIFFKCITSGFDQPQTFELKFKDFNFFKASCKVLSDDDNPQTSQRIVCEMSIVEYGIPHSLSLLEEPPTIPDVEIKHWERVSQNGLYARCYNDYTYRFDKITNYFISKKDNTKFIDIQGTIKKTINITGEENTELNINPILEIDESIHEITNCKIQFNGKLEEDKNAKMQCNVTHGNTAIFLYSVPLEHTKNYYVYFDISDNVLDLENNNSSFIYSKFWLLIIILLLF